MLQRPGPTVRRSHLLQQRFDREYGLNSLGDASGAAGGAGGGKSKHHVAFKRALEESCHLELPLDSNDGSDEQPDSGDSGDTESDSSDNRLPTASVVASSNIKGRESIKLELPMNYHLTCNELVMTNNCFDANNSGQGVDMQNLPSIAEQMERQRTWMTVYFRYRVHWYEAKPILSQLTRDAAYKPNNLPLWTRYVKVQLHRKTIFLNSIRAFRNRMQCATSGVRFTTGAFYREIDRRNPNEFRNGPEAKPLPYFRCPDDLPDIKTMVVAQMNVFVSNSTSYFDKFWDECLKENGITEG